MGPRRASAFSHFRALATLSNLVYCSYLSTPSKAQSPSAAERPRLANRTNFNSHRRTLRLRHGNATPMAWARFRYEGVPALERAGWTVEIDETFYDLFVDLSTPSAVWDARLEARAGDWFDLDLGVEIDGKRVPLLPLVVDVLRGMDRGSVPQGDV